MITGDALFARLAVRGFARVSAEIASLQDRVSAGTNDPRPSADPARAAGLSALRDLRARLDGQQSQTAEAAGRLALADQALGSLGDGARRLQQIALQAANATTLPEAAAVLRSQVRALRDEFLATANALDQTGRPLFAGTAAAPAFAEVEGRVVYTGNDGVTLAQLGDRALLATGVPGSQVFGGDATGVFALIDDLSQALAEPQFSARSAASAADLARLELPGHRGAAPVTVTLTGPSGSAQVQIDLRPDARAAAIAAVNAASAQTGITASADGDALRLSAAGEIGVAGMEAPGAAPVLRLVPLQADGSPAGAGMVLRPARLDSAALVAGAGAAVSRMAETRGEAGLLAAAVDRQDEALETQRLSVDQAVSGLEELDVAAAVTRLQSLLATQQAAQQTFVRIAGQSLFDYLG